MAIPDYQTLMLPLLKIAAEGETRIPDVVERVANEFGLTADERNALLPSGRQKVLHNRMHWAKFYMSKAGLVESPRRGRFVATAEGRALLDRNPTRIDVELLHEYPTFQEFYRSSSSPGTPSDENVEAPQAPAPASTTTPEEQIETAFDSLQLIHTLRAWGTPADEAHFVGTRTKAPILKAFGAHIFFDDQEKHIIGASSVVPAGLVPGPHSPDQAIIQAG